VPERESLGGASSFENGKTKKKEEKGGKGGKSKNEHLLRRETSKRKERDNARVHLNSRTFSYDEERKLKS